MLEEGDQEAVHHFKKSVRTVRVWGLGLFRV